MKKSEVKSFDGKDGRQAYIIYDDNIYDVTPSKMWKNGHHMNSHSAGNDLTDTIEVAPHGPEMLERFSKVGNLEKDAEEFARDRKDRLRRLYQIFHLHPVLLHFPIGILNFAAFMQLLFLITRDPSFESAACYSLLVGVLSAFPATATGIFSWWVNYDLVFSSIFKKKLMFSIVLLTMGTAAMVIRLLVPMVSVDGSGLTYLYNIMLFCCIPTMAFVAFNGGKITWPS